MINQQRGTLIQQGNIMRINNGFVEEVSCSSNSNGYIIVSYAVRRRNNITSIENIRLNLTRNTTVINSFGQSMCICCVQRGMWVNVAFSSAMTRSIPPQSNALLVVVQRNISPNRPPSPPNPPVRPQPSVETTGRIVMVDFRNDFFITEDPRNTNNQMKFIITDNTTVTNRFGFPIGFASLRPGQLVRVTHASFQTASIPPQATAFNIQIISNS